VTSVIDGSVVKLSAVKFSADRNLQKDEATEKDNDIKCPQKRCRRAHAAKMGLRSTAVVPRLCVVNTHAVGILHDRQSISRRLCVVDRQRPTTSATHSSSSSSSSRSKGGTQDLATLKHHLSSHTRRVALEIMLTS